MRGIALVELLDKLCRADRNGRPRNLHYPSRSHSLFKGTNSDQWGEEAAVRTNPPKFGSGDSVPRRHHCYSFSVEDELVNTKGLSCSRVARLCLQVMPCKRHPQALPYYTHHPAREHGPLWSILQACQRSGVGVPCSIFPTITYSGPGYHVYCI